MNQHEEQNLIYFLCNVLDQSCHNEFSKDFTTQYNYEAEAVDYLSQHGFVQIIKGSWPQTKKITFRFTDKRPKEKIGFIKINEFGQVVNSAELVKEMIAAGRSENDIIITQAINVKVLADDDNYESPEKANLENFHPVK